MFPSRNYGFRSSLFYGRDNEDKCPICENEHAKVAEGLFDLTGEAVRLIAAIATDPLKFSSIQAVSAEVLAGKISVGDGLRHLSERSPEIRSFAERASRHGFNAAWFVGIFIAVLIALVFQKIGQGGSADSIVPDWVHQECLEIANKAQNLEIEQRKRESLDRNASKEAGSETKAKPLPKGRKPKGTPKGPRFKK